MEQEVMQNCTVIPKKIINATLAQPKIPGKHLLEPLKSLAQKEGLPFNILEDCEVKSNDAEVHEHEGDLWLCLQGEVRFVVDGEIIEPKQRGKPDGSLMPGELYAEKIRDGREVILKPGDWLWIPPGAPHQHTCANTARLVIIKIPEHV